MKFLLPALLICAPIAHADGTDTFDPPHFLLLHPKATIETDAGGGCARLSNLSEGLVYVPLTEPLDLVAKAYRGILKIHNCAQR